MNTYDVPKKQWEQWSPHVQGVFNIVYGAMIGDPWAYQHPKAERGKEEHWQTVAWNAAWTAANAVDGIITKAEE